MPLFPIFLSVADRPCLVVGGGAVGRDKALRLAEAGALVLVVDPEPPHALVELAAAPSRVRVEARRFRDEDCDRRILVFACTADAAVNEAVAAAARARGALCSRSDGGDGDFSSGAMLRRGEFCVAVSSGGASPSLAAAARDQIASVIGDEYAEATRMLASLRRRIRSDISDAVDAPARREALGASLGANLLALLREGRRSDAEALVDQAFAALDRAAARTQGSPCTR